MEILTLSAILKLSCQPGTEDGSTDRIGLLMSLKKHDHYEEAEVALQEMVLKVGGTIFSFKSLKYNWMKLRAQTSSPCKEKDF